MEENREEDLIAFCIHPGAIMTKLAEAMPKDTHACRFHLGIGREEC